MIFIYIYRRGKLQIERERKRKSSQVFSGKACCNLRRTSVCCWSLALFCWFCWRWGWWGSIHLLYLIYLYLTVLFSLSLALPKCLLLAPLDFPRHMMDLGLWSENSGGQPKSRLKRVFICLCWCSCCCCFPFLVYLSIESSIGFWYDIGTIMYHGSP